MAERTGYVALAQCLGLTLPTIYWGMTFSHSFITIQPLLDHAPNDKVLAKEWLQGYQLGPAFVIPTIIPGAIANAYLAYCSTSTLQRNLYIAAAAIVWSIMPLTLAWMEPGINGACKWKVQSLLRDENYHMPPWNGISSAHRHSASEKSKRWADQWSMKELVIHWRRWNDFRWVIIAIAIGMQTYAQYAL